MQRAAREPEDDSAEDDPAAVERASALVRLRQRAMGPAQRATAVGRIATARFIDVAGRAYDLLPPLGWDGPQLQTGRPVVIVGGYGSTPGFYNLLARSYRAAGIDQVHVVPLIDNAYADIRENVNRLANLIEGLGCEVDIVGHSEGGLIARAYTKFHDGTARVPHLVTLGTPNTGVSFDRLDPTTYVDLTVLRKASELARQRLAPVVEELSSVALSQMRIGSEFMVALNGAPATPGPTHYLAIASRHDGIIPFETAGLPRAANVANIEIGEGWLLGNHAAIATTSRRAFEGVLEFLRRPVG